MARSVKIDAKQRRHASNRSLSPRTFKKLSCWPAKLAVGKSSAVAELRTATATRRALPFESAIGGCDLRAQARLRSRLVDDAPRGFRPFGQKRGIMMAKWDRSQVFTGG